MEKYIVDIQTSIYQAINQMEKHCIKFLVAVDGDMRVKGTLTVGDVQRGILRGMKLEEGIDAAVCKGFVSAKYANGIPGVLEAFQNSRIEFLPVVEEAGVLRNIVTRQGLNALLMKNLNLPLNFDFSSLEKDSPEHEICMRPWGFYRTLILNDMFQLKVIYILPGQALSLQDHRHREEHWVVVHGSGLVQIGEGVQPAEIGRELFIPKGCKHRMTNTSDTEALIFTEVQLGDYFGEDDIHRYEDDYGRV